MDSSLVWDSLGPGPHVWDCPSSVLLPVICWSAALCRRWSTRVLPSVVAVVLECCILPPLICWSTALCRRWSAGVLHSVAAGLLECCSLPSLLCWSATAVVLTYTHSVVAVAVGHSLTSANGSDVQNGRQQGTDVSPASSLHVRWVWP